jgi:hypothetical protein
VSHWLDETAEALATGRTTRRQVLLRGGLVAAAAMFGSATRPGFGLGARAKTPALFCPDLPCPDLAPDCCGEVRCYDSNAGYRCCTSAVYHREEEGCCDGKLYQLERESCCTSGEICFTTGRIGESCCDDSCCLDGTCCEGQCIGFSSDEGCCHGKRYNPERASCCTSGEICFTTGRIGESCCDDSCCLDGTCCDGTCAPPGTCEPRNSALIRCNPQKSGSSNCPPNTVCCVSGVCAPQAECGSLCSGCISNDQNMCCFGDCVNANIPSTGDFTSTSCCTETGTGGPNNLGYLGDVTCIAGGGTTRASCCKGGKQGCICRSGECCIVGPYVCDNATGGCVLSG